MHIILKVYSTQNSTFEFEQSVDVTTFSDVKSVLENAGLYDSSANYSDRATKKGAFLNLNKAVEGDVTLFKSSASSKAGS